MNNVVFIGPLVKLETLMVEKVGRKLSTVALTAGNKYSIMTSIAMECRMDANVQKLFKLTVDSFNGSMIGSEVSSIVPTIISNIVDSILNAQQSQQQTPT